MIITYQLCKKTVLRMVLLHVFLGHSLGAIDYVTNGRIIGGNETDIEDYPFVLQLHYMNKLECGGTLISNRFALTAAHCLFDKYLENFTIRAGTSTLGEGGQVFNISEVIFHPQFDLAEDNYDAAIILLSAPVSISSAEPIELATDDSAITENATIIIAGWGWKRLNTNDDFSTTLRITDLNILNDEDCENTYSSPAITEAMFCATFAGTKIRDFCFGDYGGPGVIDGVLQGVISFGDSCGDGHAGVFLRVGRIREWIQKVTEERSTI